MAKVTGEDPPALPGLAFVRNLGAGGYAEVLLYEQINTRMRVAVKILFKEGLTEQARQQFAAEANAMAELADHPNIVQVFQADVTADGRPYMVMKYYPQPTLAELCRVERLSVSAVLKIGVKISCAVETAHRAGILHRDIKPANILTSQYGEPGLADFGIATRSGVGSGSSDQGEAMSIPWAAPEVVFSLAPAGPSADVYALGATLWHLLVGHSPFEEVGGDNSDLAMMQRIRTRPVPRTGREDVPVSLERLLGRAMSKAPSERPQSALELTQALRAVEVEQRFDPTPLVLLDDSVPGARGRAEPPTSAAGAPEEPRTVRRPQNVVAQGPVDPPRLGLAVAGGQAVGHPPEAQLLTGGTDDPATVRRPRVVAMEGSALGGVPLSRSGQRQRLDLPPEPSDRPTSLLARPTPHLPDAAAPAETGEEPEGGARRRGWKLAGASAVIVAAAVGVVVAVGSGSRTTAAPSATTLSPPTLAVVSPPAPVLTGRQIGASEVRFTWSVPGDQSKVRFYWKEPGGPIHATSARAVTLHSKARVCITVEAVEGSAYSDSPVVCAG